MKRKKCSYFAVECYDNALQDPQFNMQSYVDEGGGTPVDRAPKKRHQRHRPQEEDVTPMRSQYYEVKAKYSKMIVLFQRGSFYQAYDEDADYIHRELTYNWRNEYTYTNKHRQKRLIGIPEQNLEEDMLKLISLGRSIVICQQVEDAVHHRQRSNDGVIIARRVVGIYQRGVIGLGCLCGVSLNAFEHNYLYSIARGSGAQLDVVVLDTITKMATVGCYDLEALETSFHLHPPAQVLVVWGDSTLTLIAQCMIGEVRLTPVDAGVSSSSTKILFEFLRSIYLYEDTIKLITFHSKQDLLDITTQVYDQYVNDDHNGLHDDHPPNHRPQSFALNVEALQQLYVFPRQYASKHFGSLFALLNKTITRDGERLLIEWLKHPLTDVGAIMDRQLALKDLYGVCTQVAALRNELSNVKDIQRRTIWLYGQVHQFFVARSEVCYKPFIMLKAYLQDLGCLVAHLTTNFTPLRELFQSPLLVELLSVQKLMMFQQAIGTIQSKILWQGEDLNVPSPSHQPDKQHYDDILNQLEHVENEVATEVDHLKQTLNVELTHRYTSRYQHELEIQADVALPANHGLQLSSISVGCRHYKSRIMEDLNTRQFALQSELRLFLAHFRRQLFMQFVDQRPLWNQLQDTIAHLDLLMALMLVSHEQGMSFPKFVSQQLFEALQFKNPCLLGLLPLIQQNDLTLSGDNNNCIVLTGSNGAGKSTILRSIGSLVVLAQIGCAVPCHSLTLRPFTQILTRMGACDHILEGRSTFYQELLEVRPMLDTSGALLLVDELGRGTSSSDGQALAYAILKMLIERAQNAILFTTHYHRIVDDLGDEVRFTIKYLKANKDGPDFILRDGIDRSAVSHYARLNLPQCILERAADITKHYDQITAMKTK